MNDDLGVLATLVLMASTVVLSLVVSTFLALLGGWVVMLGIGDLHHMVDGMPSVGYLAAFVVMWGLGFVGTAISRGGGSSTTLNSRGSSGISA